MPVNIMDLPVLLRQSGGKQSVRQVNIVETHCSDDLVEVFSFVPPEILACLLSFYQDELQLRRILGQDWVRSWRDGHDYQTVWQQAAEAISICDDDGSISDCAQDIAKNIARLSLQNAPIVHVTDRAHRAQLNNSGSGRQIGAGLVHGSNACLADSLLQSLAAKGILDRNLLDNSSERAKACREARQHLIQHEDYRLHPVVRDHLVSVILDDDVDHNNAFLEHDVHSEALVLFFLEYFQSTYSIAPKGFKVVVFTRFDSVRDPLLFAHTFGIVEEDLERGEPVVLELYSNTGETIIGFIMIPCF